MGRWYVGQSGSAPREWRRIWQSLWLARSSGSVASVSRCPWAFLARWQALWAQKRWGCTRGSGRKRPRHWTKRILLCALCVHSYFLPWPLLCALTLPCCSERREPPYAGDCPLSWPVGESHLGGQGRQVRLSTDSAHRSAAAGGQSGCGRTTTAHAADGGPRRSHRPVARPPQCRPA